MRRRTNTRTHNLSNLSIINLVANTRKSTVPSKAKVMKERYNFIFKASLYPSDEENSAI